MIKTISISRSVRMVPLVFVILFAGATLANSERCPPAGIIFPCVCHGDSTITDVVCSNITSEDHLKRILGGRHFQETLPLLVLQNLPFSRLTNLGLNVRNLEILDGNISDIDTLAFPFQLLLSLRIDRNRLAVVPTALSRVWESLKILSMSGNVLKKLQVRAMNYLVYVEELTLSENEISEIDPISLPRNVTYLWISRNKLTTFNGALRHTKKLKYLDASNNRLTSMNGEFDGLLRLRTVILDHNNISDISGTFSHLRNSLRELSLVGNGIREVGERMGLEYLSHLNLSRNAITNLSRTVFRNMLFLKELNLSENPLTAFQICPALTSLWQLRKVNLSNSNLTNFLSNCFNYNIHLEFMDLSRNELSSLWLKYQLELVTLDISFNNFQYVYFLLLPTNGSRTELIFEGNPWKCSINYMYEMRGLDGRGYSFPNGYPTCYLNGVKPKSCLAYL